MRPSSRRAIPIPGRPASDTYQNQATFIEGGLILTFVAQHATMDMIGQGHITCLFDKACRKEEYTAEELTASNVARHNIVPLLDDPYGPGAEVAHQIVATKPTPGTASTIILGGPTSRLNLPRPRLPNP